MRLMGSMGRRSQCWLWTQAHGRKPLCLLQFSLNCRSFQQGEDGWYHVSQTWEDALEKEMATHSSILAWDIPWTEGPGGLQSMGSPRVKHD